MRTKIQKLICFITISFLVLTGCNKSLETSEEPYKEHFIQDMEIIIEPIKNSVYTGMVIGSEQIFQLVREEEADETVWKIISSELTELDTPPTERLLSNDLFYAEQKPQQIIIDGVGNIYMRFYQDNQFVWKIVQKDNTVCEKKSSITDVSVALTGLPDGKVGINRSYWQSGASLDSANIVDLYSLDESGQERLLLSGESGVLFMTMQNEEWLVYANQEGVYRKSLKNEENILLYSWSQHNISFPEIYAMQVDNNARICMLMKEHDKLVYIRLSPPEVASEPIITQKPIEEPIQITFLGNPYTDYREVIVSFQKKYPQYTVLKVNYPDENRLIAELVSGQGPVLLDTANIDFQENETYWECLDERMVNSSLKDQLLEKVQACGQINEKQYGLVSSWMLFTFATTYQEVEDWTYVEFLDFLKSNPQLESIYSEQTPTNFIMRYFFRDLENCFFIDTQKNETFFDTTEFRELLTLAEQLAQPLDEPVWGEENTAKVNAKTRLGTDLYILWPSALSWDMEKYKDINIIGFPGANGSEHYINGGTPIVIRKTASEEEKAAAFTFLEYLLSYEGQKILLNKEGEISIRKDVLEEQLKEKPYMVTVNGEYMEPDVSTKEWNEAFMKLYDKLQPYYTFPDELSNILYEELEAYFSNGKNLDETIQILQNRIQLWLDENM